MPLWSLKDKTILIIDDFAEMRTMLRTMVQSYGAEEVTAVGNGEEAVDAMSVKKFDVVLCDYNLGDHKDGQQILEEVKHRGCLPYSSAFIMVTAETTTFMVMGALEYQPDEYLSKPVNKSVLQARLKKVLDKKSHLHDLSDALEDKNHPLAISFCDKHIKEGARNRLDLLKLKCDLLLEEQEYDKATTISDAVLAEREIPWAMFVKGKAAYLTHDYEQAQQLFNTLIEDNKNFVGAYDWLAKTLRAIGDEAGAQRALESAIECSPKSVPRLRALAIARERNGDLTGAEQMRRKVLRIGKNSVLKEPTDFTGLSNLQLQNGNPKDAIKTIEQLKCDFSQDINAKFAATVAAEKIHRDLGNNKSANKAVSNALNLFLENPNKIPSDMAIELTEACLAHDYVDNAKEVVTHLVENNHDNQEMIDDINAAFKNSGHENQAEEIVAKARKEMIRINNDGVKLLESGEIEESIKLFEKALGSAPNNHILNLNLAQSYLIFMKKKGATDRLFHDTRKCLDVVRGDEKLADRYKLLNKAYWQVVNQAAKSQGGGQYG